MSEPNIIKPISHKIGFIGGGNMAKAICEGIVSKGLVSYGQVYVSGPNLTTESWWSQRGCNISQKNGFVASEADIVFISVKPHILHTAINDITKTHPPMSNTSNLSKLYVSILAGITLNQLEKALEDLKSARIIRVMPNTPMTVGEGCTLFTPHPSATPEDINLVSTLLSVTGLCREVPEKLINVAGALTASGPAFIYMAMEALADGAVKMGLPRALATELAAQMTLGAAKMSKDTNKHTGQLKDEVCSPGGTTIQGVYALEKGGMRAAFMEAIEQATKRAHELSQL